MPERILLLGSGGREHALAHALSVSPSCEQLWSAPGNPGIWDIATKVDLTPTNAATVLQWCAENKPSLVVIGPEQPLAAGVSDVLRKNGFAVFGPSKLAAQLESSKGFAKDFMGRHRIPTARYERCSSLAEALTCLQKHALPVVIKYDGLAAGKGVVVAQTQQEAIDAATMMFDGAFGTDGVVIEDFLQGVEASIFAVTDGVHYVTLAPSHDYKRIGNDNTGKNTGGMGAIAPSPRVSPEVLERVCTHIIEPTLSGMRTEGMPFVGCLYCGVMINAQGDPSVVEFNARFGDPETQAVLQVFRGDLAALLASAARGALDSSSIVNVADGSSACVVLASHGYPDAYGSGYTITGIESAELLAGVKVFHAGTALSGDLNTLVTAGGRVLGVTAHARTTSEAVATAYQACDRIHFEGKYHRTDIGQS